VGPPLPFGLVLGSGEKRAGVELLAHQMAFEPADPRAA